MPGELEASHLGARDPYAGRVLSGRFELEGRIGSGAMGHVYRAIDRDDGSTCAIKILRPELLTDWSLIKRFHREGRAAKAIDSPHVVRILDFGESDDDVLFIAMEYLGGQTLAAWLEREGRAAPAIAIGVLRAIADATCAAHAAGVTHRDLKPENVVLGRGGGVKVVDFGIARIAEGSRAASEMAAHVTIAGSLMGTPLYMSPEAAARKQVGPAADVYALGVIAYELLTGEPPFVHDNPMHVVGMHLRVPAPRLRDTLPDLPEELDRLVHRLMAKDPGDRPSAAEAKASLDSIADALGIEAAMPIDTLEDVEAPPNVAAMLKQGGTDPDAGAAISPVHGEQTLEDPPRPTGVTGERFVPTMLMSPSRPLEAAPTSDNAAARRRVVAVAAAITVIVIVAVAVALRSGEDGGAEGTGRPMVSPDHDPAATNHGSPPASPASPTPEAATARETQPDTRTETEAAAQPEARAQAEAEPQEASAPHPPRARRPRRPPRRPPPRRPPPEEPALELDIARDYQ